MAHMRLSAEVFSRDAREFDAEVEHYDRASRRRRALRIGLPMLGGALLSLPIPGWHLIAVPAFAIGGVLLVRRRLAQVLRVISLAGDCPACGEALKFDAPPLTEFPATLPCPRCGEFLRLAELS